MPDQTTAETGRLDGDTMFLDPGTAARVGNLELVARFIVEGFLIGLHKSPCHGFSSEFSEYRKYCKGDPIRFVDWKVYGRTDRFYIKQFEENTNAFSHVFLDTSSSMDFGISTVTKFEYARCLAAAFAYLMLKQGDAAGLSLFSSRETVSIPARRGFLHLRRLLSELAAARPGAGTDFGTGLGMAPERMRRRGIVVLISDMLDDPDRILDVIKGFRYRGHEVIAFRLLTPEERDFPYRDNFEFVDAETGDKLTAQGSYIRQAYLGALAAHTEKLKQGCRDMGADFVELTTDAILSNAIAAYLAGRRSTRVSAPIA
ncbi:MAG: DUF58 domain-containing protein [Planctomycetota bacterium]|nr:DUF58 domain-containing protein [Planctomycetota bacterium]